MTARVCPVCEGSDVARLTRVDARDYWACARCQARFLDPAHYLSPADERAHYDHHENSTDDPGYRRFLSKLADPLLERLAPCLEGLDYGCGPGPALAAMLGEAGHRVALYDPFYAPDTSVLARQYEFITCTEVIEHFHTPAVEFRRLDDLLKPGGWLGVMTCFQTDDARFAAWHYRKDPTHVVFYREQTMRWLAAHHDWAIDIPAKDVAIMQKPG